MPTIAGTMDEPTEADLPQYVADAVDAMAKVHADHQLDASKLDRRMAQMTAWLGHPAFSLFLSGFVLVWLLANQFLPSWGSKAFDPAPYPLLAGLVALGALYMTAIILTTQRREDLRAARREQLTLELAIVIDHKTSKLIALMESLRLDNPNVVNRVDPEAEAMSSAANPQIVLDAIIKTHEADPDSD